MLVYLQRDKRIDARRAQRRPDARDDSDGALGKRDCEVDQRVQDVHADEHRLSEPHGDRSDHQTSDEPRRQEPRAPFQHVDDQMLWRRPHRYAYAELPHASAHGVDDDTAKADGGENDRESAADRKRPTERAERPQLNVHPLVHRLDGDHGDVRVDVSRRLDERADEWSGGSARSSDDGQSSLEVLRADREEQRRPFAIQSASTRLAGDPDDRHDLTTGSDSQRLAKTAPVRPLFERESLVDDGLRRTRSGPELVPFLHHDSHRFEVPGANGVGRVFRARVGVTRSARRRNRCLTIHSDEERGTIRNGDAGHAGERSEPIHQRFRVTCRAIGVVPVGSRLELRNYELMAREARIDGRETGIRLDEQSSDREERRGPGDLRTHQPSPER